MTDAQRLRLIRSARFLAMWHDGMTYRDIGQAEGVGITRADELIKYAMRDVEMRRISLMHSLSSPLRAELLIRRALAVWSAHNQERT